MYYFFGSTYFHTVLMKNVFNIIFFIFLIIELITACFSLINSVRGSKESKKHDYGSMLLIMAGICVCILSNPVIIFFMPYVLPYFIFWVGILISSFGIVLRVVSILTLKHFFTFSVQISNNQTIVQTGPYQFLRHPAYTGSILTLLGITLSFRSPAGILITIFVAAIVYGYRIKVEERELEKNFGDIYTKYENHTWRLLPFIW